jgi:hypothetical protein
MTMPLINVFLPIAVGIFVCVIGVILMIAFWALYKLIGRGKAGNVLTILSQAVISLVGTAVIGLIALGFAFGLQIALSVLK